MKDEKELNIEIFDLVNQVFSKPISDKPVENKDDNFIGINEIARFEKVESFISSTKDQFGTIIELYKGSIGLKKDGCRQLRNIADKIIELNPYSKFATIEFIEKVLFDWIIDVFLSKKVEIEPLIYLNQRFEKDINDYNFYFRIESLGIQKPFKIGQVEFTFFDDKFLDSQLEKFKRDLPNRSEKDFNLLFKVFISKPIVKISSKGIKDKAEQNAKRSINLSIDILKCFLVKESIDLRYKLLDVGCRFSVKNSLFIYDTVLDKFDFNICLKINDGVKPVSLNFSELEKRSEPLMLEGNLKPDMGSLTLSSLNFNFNERSD